jgi:copper transport protein
MKESVEALLREILRGGDDRFVREHKTRERPMSKRQSWFFWMDTLRIGKRSSFFAALALAFFLLLAFPAPGQAHAVLLRSDPAQNAVLRVPPRQVHLWFSEAITPQLSTAQVVTPTNQQAGRQQVSIPPENGSELVVTLQSTLPPGIYEVLWRTYSSDDGHIETGSFSFTVTRPDGTLPPIPQVSAGPGTGSSSTSLPASLLDGPTLLSLLMITLLELGAICWLGATFWQIFVLEPVMEKYPMQATIYQQVRQRLHRVQLLAVLVTLLAHLGVLVGQALALTQGNEATAFTPGVLANLLVNGSFGHWWEVRVFLLLLVLHLLLYQRQVNRYTASRGRFLCWVSLLLGLVFLLALAMSSHAAAAASDKVLLAVLADWVHLLAAALWVGGMLTIALSYLPVLKRQSLSACATSLLTLLPHYSPLALAGVLLMALTGPVSATIQLTSWEQLVATPYDQVLLIKILLVAGLLLLSAYHVLVLRPRVRMASQSYVSATAHLSIAQAETEPDHALHPQAEQFKQAETQLAHATHRLMRVLRTEPYVGVAVLLCVGLLNVLGGTLVPPASAGSVHQVRAGTASPTTILETFDHRFRVILMVTPKQVGTNHFSVSVFDQHTGAPVSMVKVQLNTEMPEMDMGIAVVPLPSDGHGQYRGTDNLAMIGQWRIIVQIQTPDDPYHFHEAYTDMLISS